MASPGTALTHVCPHPLEQHFCCPPQSISCWHSSAQVPTPPSTAGHVPGFGTKRNLNEKKKLVVKFCDQEV